MKSSTVQRTLKLLASEVVYLNTLALTTTFAMFKNDDSLIVQAPMCSTVKKKLLDKSHGSFVNVVRFINLT